MKTERYGSPGALHRFLAIDSRLTGTGAAPLAEADPVFMHGEQCVEIAVVPARQPQFGPSNRLPARKHVPPHFLSCRYQVATWHMAERAMCHARKCHACKSVTFVVSVTYLDWTGKRWRAADSRCADISAAVPIYQRQLLICLKIDVVPDVP